MDDPLLRLYEEARAEIRRLLRKHGCTAAIETLGGRRFEFPFGACTVDNEDTPRILEGLRAFLVARGKDVG